MSITNAGLRKAAEPHMGDRPNVLIRPMTYMGVPIIFDDPDMESRNVVWRTIGVGGSKEEIEAAIAEMVRPPMFGDSPLPAGLFARMERGRNQPLGGAVHFIGEIEQ